MSGDSKKITYKITVNASRSSLYDSSDKIDTVDLKWLQDDVAAEIKTEIRGTSFKGASITGSYTVKY